jgi:putative phosphoribosyl transferase
MSSVLFADRADAGTQLAERLKAYEGRSNALVLALPRGGVPIGFEVARRLDLPLDVFVVRKLGVPNREELALGAIASGGIRVLNEAVVAALGIDEQRISQIAADEERELRRRERTYRDAEAPLELAGKTVLLVDDGLATGSTMRAAATALRAERVARLVVGVPIAAPEICAEFDQQVDEIVCVHTPERFYAVGLAYEDFSQIGDEEVHNLLRRARRASVAQVRPASSPAR